MTEFERPLYTVFQYGDTGVFKVVKFKRGDGIKTRVNEKEKEKPKNEEKLRNNLARAKSKVLQLALCNDWTHFVTFTLDKDKYNRNDLEKFQKDLSQWFRNKSKKYDCKIRFLYVPERHKDGAWHAHGLLGNVPDSMFKRFDANLHPIKLVRKGYLNIPEYEKKFGFVSAARIKNKVACAFYITKYITKAVQENSLELGTHLYYASKGLNKAIPLYDVYYDVPALDNILNYHGDYCSTGIIQTKNWTFGLDYNPEFRDIEQWAIEQYLEEENNEKVEENHINFYDNPYDDVSFYDIGIG